VAITAAGAASGRAWIGSVDDAINKAFSARAFDISIAGLGENAQPCGWCYGIQDSDHGRVMIFVRGASFVVSKEFSLDEAPDAYERFDRHEEGYSKVVLKPAS
jgi:hypothetical protein